MFDATAREQESSFLCSSRPGNAAWYNKFMGRDLRLYPQNANKKELVSFVKSFGNIQQTTHLWDWPEGSVHYRWFDEVDYASVTGVEVTIYPVPNEESTYTDNRWAMHVRNTYSASWADVNMLNTFLRKGRKKFGGNVIGDYGKNRYAPLWSDDSTPMSRGLSWVRSLTDRNLDAVIYSLPKEMELGVSGNDMEEFLNIVKQNDPSRVIYNGLIPFLISTLEFYLKNIFIISLRYDPGAQLKVADRGLTVEQISDKISFQDLRNVNKAFRSWLGIDIKERLDDPCGEPEVIWKQLNNLIQYRHDIIHQMGVDSKLSRNDFIKQAELVKKAMEAILDVLVKKYEITVDTSG